MTEPTYTAVSRHGDLINTGLTLREAAQAVLWDDGRDYELRALHGGGFQVWSRQEVAGVPWHSTTIHSLNANVAEAEVEIFEKVVRAQSVRQWRSAPVIMTDAEWAREQADAMMEE